MSAYLSILNLETTSSENAVYNKTHHRNNDTKMPFLGLSRSASQDRAAASVVDSSIGRHIFTAMDGTVRFLPAMMDMSNSTQPISTRHSAMSLLWMDVKLMALNLVHCMPERLRSLYTMDLGRSMMRSMEKMDVMDICLQVMLGIFQTCMLAMIVPVCLMLPGIMFIPVLACCMGLCMMLCWPMNNGKMIMRCECCPERMGDDVMADERWFHINGSMTR